MSLKTPLSFFNFHVITHFVIMLRKYILGVWKTWHFGLGAASHKIHRESGELMRVITKHAKVCATNICELLGRSAIIWDFLVRQQPYSSTYVTIERASTVPGNTCRDFWQWHRARVPCNWHARVQKTYTLLEKKVVTPTLRQYNRYGSNFCASSRLKLTWHIPVTALQRNPTLASPDFHSNAKSDRWTP